MYASRRLLEWEFWLDASETAKQTWNSSSTTQCQATKCERERPLACTTVAALCGNNPWTYIFEDTLFHHQSIISLRGELISYVRYVTNTAKSAAAKDSETPSNPAVSPPLPLALLSAIHFR